MPYKEGIKLASEGEWDQLIERLQQDPSLAQQKDHYGMVPLHWACTDDDVPLEVLQVLLDLYPEGALMRNNAQMLPLHVAIRGRSSASCLEILLEAHPSSIIVESTNGKLPLDLAVEASLDPKSLEVLEQANHLYRSSGSTTDSEASSFAEAKRDIMERTSSRSSGRSVRRKSDNYKHRYSGERLSQASRKSDVSKMTRRKSSDLRNERRVNNTSLNAMPIYNASELDVCGVCEKKFSMFRKKYFCYSCKIPLCKRDLAGKIALPHYFSKKHVCPDCFDTYNRESENQNEPHPLRNTTALGDRSSSTELPKRHHSINLKLQADSCRKNSSGTLYDRKTSQASTTANSDGFLGDINLRDSDESSSEILALQQRVVYLEEYKAKMDQQHIEQQKVQNETMLLLTETMTRVAELEIRCAKIDGGGSLSDSRISSISSNSEIFVSPYTEDFGQSNQILK